MNNLLQKYRHSNIQYKPYYGSKSSVKEKKKKKNQFYVGKFWKNCFLFEWTVANHKRKLSELCSRWLKTCSYIVVVRQGLVI